MRLSSVRAGATNSPGWLVSSCSTIRRLLFCTAARFAWPQGDVRWVVSLRYRDEHQPGYVGSAARALGDTEGGGAVHRSDGCRLLYSVSGGTIVRGPGSGVCRLRGHRRVASVWQLVSVRCFPGRPGRQRRRFCRLDCRRALRSAVRYGSLPRGRWRLHSDGESTRRSFSLSACTY